MVKHRLPSGVRPLAYALHLDADPARDTFTGHVTIEVDIEEATDRIQMHAVGLTVGDAKVLQKEALTAEAHAEGDRLALRLPQRLSPGPASLTISYTGKVRHDMAGLYLSKDGPRSCLATQCEATDARSIVPCWDEPEHKATWQWTVTAPEQYTVLTNGATTSQETTGGKTTHHFAPTPLMSSYLIACCIGEFASTTSVDARGHAMRVWASRGQEQHGVHGNGLAARMLPWYEDYFGQSYAFGKYDQIAVPSFAFGAMENAGLVLFRPSLVLMDEATASWDDRRHVALVVAHEFAHMWFGNLVTMAWWDDLWLNEAFAEWIAHKCADAMDPDLDVWVPFRQRAAGALSTDALASTHAIYHPVQTPEEAQEMFDAVTYGKGSAVMRMLESYLGEDVFRSGLQTYMDAFAFANAQGRDLWDHLGEASGEDVAGIMGDWVTRPGHPTVTARLEGSRLALGQARTIASPMSEVPATTWRIPLVVRYEDDAGVHEARHLLTDEEGVLPLDVQGALKWVWPNAGDGGFYRSELSEEVLEAACEHADRLLPAERVALLRDLWNQVQAGRRPVDRFLQVFASLLDPEDHYEVVEYLSAVARTLDGLLQDDDAQDAFRTWLGARVRSRPDPAGSREEGASDADIQRRAAVLRILGIAQEPSGIQAARRIAEDERNDPARVTAALAGTAIAVEALCGDTETLGEHLATYEARRAGDFSPQEVERYVYALPAYRDPAAVAGVLQVLAEQGVAAQAVGPILRAMLASPYAGRAAWDHMKANWDDTGPRLGEAWLGIIVEACGALPTDLDEEVHAFWDARLDGHAAHSYARAKERLRQRKELEERIGDDLRAWARGLAVAAVP